MNLSNTTILSLTSAAALLASCASDRPPVVTQDARGNYVTTAEYEAMERSEFVDAMNAGIRDVDRQMSELRSRANELGGDALREFADCEEDLRDKRVELENQLRIAKNSLSDEWPDERSETVDAFYELRDALNEAYDDVLDT